MLFFKLLLDSTTAAYASDDGTNNAHKSYKLRLVANYWEPYTGDNLDRNGLAGDIVLSTLNKAGIEAEIKILPWARAYKMVQEGKADGIVAIWHTEEREKYILFSNAYLRNEIVLLKRTDKDFYYKDLSSLANLTLGLGRGYDYHDNLKNYPHINKVYFTRIQHAIGMLYQGRIDAVLDDKKVVEYHVQNRGNELFSNNFDFVTTSVFELPLYFGMSKKYPDADKVIKKFNDKLKSNLKIQP